MEILHWDKQQKVDIVKRLLESSRYTFEHPTLILEGGDGWFVILTPKRKPHQVIVHLDRENKPDFWDTIPELIS